MEDAYRFAPAAPGEAYVYGAAAPGWHTAADHETAVSAWIDFMREREIERVCCLVPGADAEGCQYNLDRYAAAFGEQHVLHAPLLDRRLGHQAVLEESILPFLEESVRLESPVVVHGLAGLGRTGQVLAAWLVDGREYEPESAIETVEEMGRFPEEPVEDGNVTEEELLECLAAVE
ncbi:protein-tyrosine phosphatase family protein [Halorhabdus amylolytica]|uniref:protein-tyrosine phosphatase family protein n=1 Tax=Halorhabdus amylolytica TaxID=2559573 RepID=UPI0010AA091A|nr:dual specificity protein phosphatase family protein [Halorhabdus amylolytica]